VTYCSTVRLGLGVEAFCSQLTPGGIGASVRWGYRWLAPYYPKEIRTLPKRKAPPSGGTFLLSRMSVPD